MKRICAIAVLSVLFLAGCQPKPTPYGFNTFTPIEDLQRISQNPSTWETFLDPYMQETLPFTPDTALYKKRFFAPWFYSQTEKQAFDLSSAAGRLAQQCLFGPHLHPYNPLVIQTWLAQTQLNHTHSIAASAIIVRDSDVRILPTHQPCFYDAHQGGEGYPFDNCQNDRLYVGTPVYVSHTSKDRGWSYVICARSQGWVPAQDVALIKHQDALRLSSRPLVTFLRDKQPIYNAHGHFMAYVPLGAQLPLHRQTSSRLHVLWPFKDHQGYAHWKTVPVTTQIASAEPLTLTPQNALPLLQELIDQPYGWGTYLGNRDCSALLKDYFAAFHIFLPRNSKAQASQGHVVSLKNLSIKEQKQRILKEAIPFRTTLYAPGHIGLYVGSMNQEPMMLHAIWSNKINVCGQEGRNVIGRSVITTLEWGKELSGLIPEKFFMNRLESMSTF